MEEQPQYKLNQCEIAQPFSNAGKYPVVER